MWKESSFSLWHHSSFSLQRRNWNGEAGRLKSCWIGKRHGWWLLRDFWDPRKRTSWASYWTALLWSNQYLWPKEEAIRFIYQGNFITLVSHREVDFHFCWAPSSILHLGHFANWSEPSPFLAIHEAPLTHAEQLTSKKYLGVNDFLLMVGKCKKDLPEEVLMLFPLHITNLLNLFPSSLVIFFIFLPLESLLSFHAFCMAQDGALHTWHGLWNHSEKTDYKAQRAQFEVCWSGGLRAGHGH